MQQGLSVVEGVFFTGFLSSNGAKTLYSKGFCLKSVARAVFKGIKNDWE